MEQGLLHLYWGAGKGKTTAAMGLALRALGAGLRVSVVQFLKDGSSSEIAPLRRLGAAVFAGDTGGRFVFEMTGEERAQARLWQDEALRGALETDCDLLVLDEGCAACALGMVNEALLRRAVLGRPGGREVVLTGRDPADWMRQAADYSTEMRAERHPFDRGVAARAGIEY